MSTCEQDTGTMYGCRPVCDQLATVTLTHEGYGGSIVTRLCERHAGTVSARIWPYRVLSSAPS